MKRLIAIAALAAVLASCGGGGGERKPASSGGLYEVFVVCTDERWDGALGDTLRAIMTTPVQMINQQEPSFTLLHILPTGFNPTIARHRNILSVKNGAEFAQPSITAQYDVYSSPQLVVQVTGPTPGSITQYLSDNRAELMHIFELAERDRSVALAARFNERALGEMIKKKFDVELDVPKGYKLRTESEDFIWMSHERPIISQGFFIYSFPYEGKEDFDPEYMIARRNEFGSRIPGPSDGSYMSTFTEDEDLAPVVSYMVVNGRHWARMNGFWEVEGDYMGGPFVTYATLNPVTRRVVVLDCYLFSPKHPKRNFFRQLEHLVFSVRVPEAVAAE
ncbi:MAG: DUF4837 family protein [Rikenellaceae bacterium]|jgi:hypothetical protein|nr:DUF4837 family protein [Rikenellaceae bacterium]